MALRLRQVQLDLLSSHSRSRSCEGPQTDFASFRPQTILYPRRTFSLFAGPPSSTTPPAADTGVRPNIEGGRTQDVGRRKEIAAACRAIE